MSWPGIVVVNASANVQRTGGALLDARCAITISSSLSGEPLQYVSVTTGQTSAAVALTRGYEVVVEETLSVNLVCDAATGDGNIRDSFMTAVFAPS